MCQCHTVNSQNLARHLVTKSGPPKNLPWTDKFCHFVMFETLSALPQPNHLRSRVMRHHLAVIPAKSGIQRRDVGLPRPAADILSDDTRCRFLTDRWIPAFAGMTSVRHDDLERFPSLGPQPFALSHPFIHQFSICNSPSHSW